MQFKDRKDAMNAFNQFIAGFIGKELSAQKMMDEIESWIRLNFSQSEGDQKVIKYIGLALHPDRFTNPTNFRGFSAENISFIASLSSEKGYFYTAFDNINFNQKFDAGQSTQDGMDVDQEKDILEEEIEPIYDMLANIIVIENALKDNQITEEEQLAHMEGAAKIEQQLNEKKKIHSQEKFNTIVDAYRNAQRTGVPRAIQMLEMQMQSNILARELLEKIETKMTTIMKRENLREEALTALDAEFEKSSQLQNRVQEVFQKVEPGYFKAAKIIDSKTDAILRENPDADFTALGLKEVEAIAREIEQLKKELTEAQNSNFKEIDKLRKNIREGVGDQKLQSELVNLRRENKDTIQKALREIDEINKNENAPHHLIQRFENIKFQKESKKAELTDFSKIHQSISSVLQNHDSSRNTSNRKGVLNSLNLWKKKSQPIDKTSSVLSNDFTSFIKSLENSDQKGISRFEMARGYLYQTMLDNQNSPAIIDLSKKMIEAIKTHEQAYLKEMGAKYATTDPKQIPVKASGACLADYQKFKAMQSSSPEWKPASPR